MTRSPSGAEVEARLREASRLAGSLRPEDRLATKVDLSAAGVAARLKEASDLLETCRALARAGAEWAEVSAVGSKPDQASNVALTAPSPSGPALGAPKR